MKRHAPQNQLSHLSPSFAGLNRLETQLPQQQHGLAHPSNAVSGSVLTPDIRSCSGHICKVSPEHQDLLPTLALFASTDSSIEGNPQISTLRPKDPKQS